MAIKNKVFVNCCTGSGAGAIYKTFTVETTAFTTSLSSVVYSGDGACYVYTGVDSVQTPLQTFLTADYYSVSGGCTPCRSANPNTCYYSFSSCCTNTTFSFRRGDIELGSAYQEGDVFYWVVQDGPTVLFEGCASVVSSITGSTIYNVTGGSVSATYSLGYTDCTDCITSHPCLPPTPTPTPTPFGNGNTFGYELLVTGTCINGFGSVQINASGGTSPYTFDWYDPSLGLGDYKTGLSAGTYKVRANDSTLPINNQFYINVIVPSGLTVDITSIVNTTCGNNNGSLTVSATSDSSNITYYLYGYSGFVASQITNNNLAIFNNLSAGTYSVTAISNGCTATTDTCIVYSSNPLNFGFYIVNDTECASPTGKVYVTGVTGNSPFTYLWDDSTTGTSITGLTTGTYGCTVTSGDGCVLSKTAFVDYVPSIGLGSWTAVTPTCFEANGSLTLTITGGTGPYFYSGSNGDVQVTYAQSYTFSGLPAGAYSVEVTDAALCKAFFATSINTPNTFQLISIETVNSTCSSIDGEILISVLDGSPPYTYTLIKPNSNTLSVTTNSTTQTFTDLESGEYTLFISDGGNCVYSTVLTIIAENKFTVTPAYTGSTCNNADGQLRLTLTTGGTAPYVYTLDNGDSITSSFTSMTFNSLVSGTYNYSVTDYLGCQQIGTIALPISSNVNFSLYPTSCGTGSGGTITALITSGQPPFTFDWSSNVSGNPQNIFVSGLTGGTYSLTITDSNDCVQKRNVLISCFPIKTTYQVFTMCETEFTYTSGTKRGMLQMLNEGYNDLTSGNTNCILNSSTFIVSVNVSGVTYSQSFYNGTSLLDVPTDQEWYDAVYALLITIPEVSDVTIDTNSGQITVETINGLDNQSIQIDLIIQYYIFCES
jgi:uncharacterized protein (DUF2141 family)